MALRSAKAAPQVAGLQLADIGHAVKFGQKAESIRAFGAESRQQNQQVRAGHGAVSIHVLFAVELAPEFTEQSEQVINGVNPS